MFSGAWAYFKLCSKNEKWLLTVSVLFFISQEILGLFNLIFPKFIIDSIIEKRGIYYLVAITLIFLVANFGLKILERLLMHMFNTKVQRLNVTLSQNICAEVSKVDYEILEQDRYINKINLAGNLIWCFNGVGIHAKIAMIISKIFNLIAMMIILATFNIWIVLLILMMVGVNTYFKNQLSKKEYKLNREVEKPQRRASYIKKVLKEREFGKEVRINTLTNHFLDELKHTNKEIYNKNKRKEKINTFLLPQISTFLNFIQEGIVYLILVRSVLSGGITIGSFTVYIQAISKFSNSILDVMRNIVEFKNANLYFDDFQEVFKLPKEMLKGTKVIEAPTQKHTIEFKNVSFKYPNNENYILKNINIKIEEGEKLAIVGENGAGKTTFIKLLLRLYNVTEGQILLDGVDIKELDYKCYMDTLSVVFQDYKLFYESMKENITLNKYEDAVDEEVVHILERSGFKENLKKFPKGIHTTLYK